MAKKKKNTSAKVHKDLDGLNVNVDSLGEVTGNMNIDQINEFLNKNVEDKKLKDRDPKKDK